MPVHEHDPLVDESLRHTNSTPWIALIVADDQAELLSKNAAVGVQVVDRLLRAAPELFAENGEIAAHRTSDADYDLVAGWLRLFAGFATAACASGEQQRGCGEGQSEQANFHVASPYRNLGAH
jgi:hypothetical protein